MKNKRKVTTAIIAGVTALALMLGGTFAWQSINQTALNEASDVINPGGRLHDDFDGSNKDIYVENFADEDIFARIQLSEYLAIIANHGVVGAEKRNEIIGSMVTDEDGNVTYNYETYKFDGNVNEDGTFKAGIDTTDNNAYWNWTTGGSTVYMPTFNLNKDSLVADINGTYVDAVGGISNRDGNQYTDYEEYEAGATEEGTEIYDGDTNQADEIKDDFDNWASYPDNVVAVETVTHTVKNTLTTTGLISMADWLAMVDAAGGYDAAAHGNYWVYDTDGWVYWSAPIAGRNEDGTTNATGLLLDGIELNGVMDDTWYYAINVVAQFVTADDVGNTDGTGFYDTENGTVPSEDAENLLGLIGVQMDGEAPEVADNFKIAVKATADEYGYIDPSTIDSSLNGSSGDYGGDSVELVLNNNDTAITEGVTWKMELVDGGQDDEDTSLLDGTAIDENTGVLTVEVGETQWKSGGYDVETYHVVKVTASVDGVEKASRKFVISGSGVYVSRLDFYEEGTDTLANESSLEVGKTYDLRGTLFNQTLYTDISRIITNSMDPIYVDGLTFSITDDEGNPVAGAVVENGKFTATEAGTYTVSAEGTLENWGEVSLYNYGVTVVDGGDNDQEDNSPVFVSTEDGTELTVTEVAGSPTVIATEYLGQKLIVTLPEGQTSQFVLENETGTSAYVDYEPYTEVNTVTLQLDSDEQGLARKVVDGTVYYHISAGVGYYDDEADFVGFYLDVITKPLTTVGLEVSGATLNADGYYEVVAGQSYEITNIEYFELTWSLDGASTATLERTQYSFNKLVVDAAAQAGDEYTVTTTFENLTDTLKFKVVDAA